MHLLVNKPGASNSIYNRCKSNDSSHPMLLGCWSVGEMPITKIELHPGQEKIQISPWLVTLLHICGVIPTPQSPISPETPCRYRQKLHANVNIIVIIINLESAVQGRQRVRTLYQSKDPNPAQPTHGRKKKIKQ